MKLQERVPQIQSRAWICRRSNDSGDYVVHDRLVIACRHCHSEGEPVLVVVHTASDDCFQFLCGRSDHGVEDGDPIHVVHLVQGDPSLDDVLTLEKDFIAERLEKGLPWVKRPLTPDELGD